MYGGTETNSNNNAESLIIQYMVYLDLGFSGQKITQNPASQDHLPDTLAVLVVPKMSPV